MIFVFLLQVFAAMILVNFAAKATIATWPDSFIGRMLTFTFA
jgi:hypothetical protein